MNSITREHPHFSDDEIIEIARSVEPHDFDRIAPPQQVWNNMLAELEVEVASQEATARRASQPWYSSPRLLSAAAVVLLMVGITVAVVATQGNDTQVQEQELAAAMMSDEGLPVSTTATANAAVVCDEDGSCFVDLSLTELPEAGTAELELWVINGDVTDMHSLGNLSGTADRYPWPATVTADDFPIVDISIEPNDGDPTHSGQSVLRGTFEKG